MVLVLSIRCGEKGEVIFNASRGGLLGADFRKMRICHGETYIERYTENCALLFTQFKLYILDYPTLFGEAFRSVSKPQHPRVTSQISNHVFLAARYNIPMRLDDGQRDNAIYNFLSDNN